MLYEIMRHIRNYFPTDTREAGKFTIEDGTISPSFVSEGQYFLIEGSNLNDGVYQAPVSELTDETFEGSITLLAPPKAFLELAAEIETFNSQDTTAASPFTGESFGGYSYTKATKNGVAVTWQDVFRSKLNTYRKI